MLLAGVLAAIPAIGRTIQAIHAGWTPTSDDGVIALRAFDVFSAHTPLLGQYSQTSPLIHQAAFSLGPMLYWLVAIPVRIGPAAIVITMGAVSVAMVLLIVWLAGRRAGTPGMLLTALLVAATFRSMPAEVPYEIWNCWAGLLPFIATIFLAWSVACGDEWLLPGLVVVGSYAVQCHLVYVAPVVGVAAVAIVTLRSRRWVGISAVTLAACWCLPLIQQFSGGPGNLVLATRLATNGHPKLGLDTGLYTLARAIGLPPAWTQHVPSPGSRFADLYQAPSAFTDITAALIVAALIALLLRSWQHRSRTLTAAAATSLVLCAAVITVGAAIPTGQLAFAASLYTLTWTAPAGMFVYLTLGLAALSILPRVALTHRLELVTCAAVGLVAVLVATRNPDVAQSLPPRTGSYNQAKLTAAGVLRGVGSHRPVLLDIRRSDENTLTLGSAIALVLRRHSITEGLPPSLAMEAGGQYCPHGGYQTVVTISSTVTMVHRGSPGFAADVAAVHNQQPSGVGNVCG